MSGIRIGRPDAKPDTPCHVGGMGQGNTRPRRQQPGHHEDGTSDARRSTGVHWKRHDAIMDIMPNVSPG
jgi:hypothetical protein